MLAYFSSLAANSIIIVIIIIIIIVILNLKDYLFIYFYTSVGVSEVGDKN